MTNIVSKIILGVDPGIADTGYGVIKKTGANYELICYGSIKTPAKAEMLARLKSLHEQLEKVIKKYQPHQAAIEQLFFCKNVKTALVVGQARGVALMTLAENNLPIQEFTPLQIKQSIAGYGQADKKQVGQMVKILLKLESVPRPDDAADALAIALTAGQTNSKLK